MNELKKIPLTQNKFALVDAEDYEWLCQWKWCVNNSGYAVRVVNKKVILMHRIIMKTPKNKVTDHINRNRLDNRKENLRICNQSVNGYNRHFKLTKIRGIHWREDLKKWRTIIYNNNRQIHIGVFESLEKAFLARKKAERKFYGQWIY